MPVLMSCCYDDFDVTALVVPSEVSSWDSPGMSSRLSGHLLVLRPALSLAAGADLIDDTIFGLSVTFALPH